MSTNNNTRFSAVIKVFRDPDDNSKPVASFTFDNDESLSNFLAALQERGIITKISPITTH